MTWMPQALVNVESSLGTDVCAKPNGQELLVAGGVGEFAPPNTRRQQCSWWAVDPSITPVPVGSEPEPCGRTVKPAAMSGAESRTDASVFSASSGVL